MREVVLGRSARIWQAIKQRPGMGERFRLELGHAQLHDFAFTPEDRVWVFAYSRIPADNTAMLRHLQKAGVAEVVYVTSSSTIIASHTRCYAYPRAKKLAEDQAAAMLQGKVLTLGLVVADERELPAGCNAATMIDEIADFMLDPQWPLQQGTRAHLLRMVQRPFSSALERSLYGLYDNLMQLCGTQPCLLRPLDFMLRLLGMRWYGYTFMSNRLWTSLMTS